MTHSPAPRRADTHSVPTREQKSSGVFTNTGKLQLSGQILPDRRGTHTPAACSPRVSALRRRSRQQHLAADTPSSSAAPKGSREVTLLLAGSLRPAGGSRSSAKPRLQQHDTHRKRTTMLETYFAFGSRRRIHVCVCPKRRVHGACERCSEATREPRGRCSE